MQIGGRGTILGGSRTFGVEGMASLEVCYWRKAFEGFKLALLWPWLSVLIWYHIKAAAMNPSVLGSPTPAAMPSLP